MGRFAMHEGLFSGLHNFNVKKKKLKYCRERYYQTYVAIVLQWYLFVTIASVKEGKMYLGITYRSLF